MAQTNLANIQNYNSATAQEAKLREKLQEVSESSAPAKPPQSEEPDSDVIQIKPDPNPVKFMKGKLVSVDCTSEPAATLTITSGGKNWKMVTSDAKKLVLIGADEFSCGWKNKSVAVNYRATANGEGKLVSLEFE